MRSALTLLLVAALSASGCNNDSPTQPTGPTTPSTFTETFAGTLPALGNAFYSFSVFQTGQVSLMFGSLTPTGTDTPLDVPLWIGFGIPKGTGCDVSSPVLIAPGLTYQVSNTFLPGTYCVNINDFGALTGSADFAIRIVQYPSDTAPGDPGSSLFRSDLTVGGVGVRTFTATQAGTVVVSLTELGPPPGVEASVGIGLPSSDGSGGCNVATAIVASAPAEFSLPVVAGVYCVKIADVGNFTGTTTFSITIVRP
jgi:hypothetical protein